MVQVQTEPRREVLPELWGVAEWRQTMKRVIGSFRVPGEADAAWGTTYLWVVVRDMTGNGSTVASRICRELGFDPDEKVVPPTWCRVEADWCDVHEQMFRASEGCELCREGEEDESDD